MATSFIDACDMPVFICRRDKPTDEFIPAIKDTFSQARAQAPSIILLDDLDKFSNSDSEKPDSEEYVTVQSCIDSCKDSGVFVLATANDLDVLPESLLRNGRFDSIIHLSLPSYRDAVKIFDHYLKQKGLHSVDSDLVARLMHRTASCADLETIANEAVLIAAYNGDSAIETQHFIKACLKAKFSIESADYAAQFGAANMEELKNNPDAYKQALKIAYHEAGHTVISEALAPGSVTLVSLNGQGDGMGGFTSRYSDESSDSISTAKDNAIVFLGGRAAIEMKFGSVCAGCENDLDNCYNITAQLICGECISGFDRFRIKHRWGYDNLDERSIAVVTQKIEETYQKAKEILAGQSAFLDRLAMALLDKGLLLRDDIARLKEAAEQAVPA